MWCLSTKSSQISPWQPVVETNMWLFCRIQSNLAPCDSLYTKTPSPLTHTRHLDHHYCTHANVSGRNHFVCLACSLYMFCAAPPNPPVTDAHIHTLLLLSPWIFLQSLIFVRPGRPGLVQRDADPEPAALRHRMPVWSLSESFMCSFYLYGQSCFHHLGLHLSRTAHNFSLHS